MPRLASPAALAPSLLAPLVLLGCAADDVASGADDVWRLPCAATGAYDDAPDDVYAYRYDYDDLGNETFVEVTAPDGAVTVTQRGFVGRQLVHSDTRAGDHQGHWTATLDGADRVAEVRFRTTGGDDDAAGYAEAWTWDGDDLVSIVTTFDGATREVMTESFVATDLGFDSIVCWSGDDTCDRYGYVGAEHVGDLRHWTLFDADFDDDGAIDYRMTQAYDDLGLPVDGALWVVRDGRLAIDVADHIDRGADGAPRAFRSESATTGRTWRQTYDYACGGAERVAPRGDGLPVRVGRR